MNSFVSMLDIDTCQTLRHTFNKLL